MRKVLFVVMCLLLAGCATDCATSTTPVETNDNMSISQVEPVMTEDMVEAETAAVEPEEEIKMPEETIVVFETNQGNIEFKLYTNTAPKTCENFTTHVKDGYYDGLIFHRVIENFMIQGGDPTGTGRGGQSIWGKPFEDEVTPEVKFDKTGLLAMANAGPNTNGSQFFITTVKTPWLNMKHTIFGEVVSGYDVVQKIEQTPKGPGDKPVEDQKIIKAYLK